MRNWLLAVMSLLLLSMFAAPLQTDAATASANYSYSLPKDFQWKQADSDRYGNVYVLGVYKQKDYLLQAIGPDGKKKWSITGPAANVVYFKIGLDNKLYLQVANTLYAYGLDGKMIWSKTIKAGVEFRFLPGGKSIRFHREDEPRVITFAPNGKPDENVILKNKSDVPVFEYDTSVWHVIKANGSIDIYDGNTYLFNLMPKGYRDLSPRAISDDGQTIYVYELRDAMEWDYSSIYAYDRKGKIKWKYQMEGYRNEADNIVALPNGNIIFYALNERGIIMLGKDGKVTWKKSNVSHVNLTIQSMKDGFIINNEIYDLKGKLKRKVDVPQKGSYFFAKDLAFITIDQTTVKRLRL
ncbi:hypothetical protein [Paenibacillus sp. MMS18-CY102]|uniref:hypothetical protein n=1 Tax=Paenibacillus sp. MMS18-CY102 TaxID=2682849 RepID=UPI0013652816|nr:hypothetical protein [Paenibacillus sp. MMS18-CY102]MWC29307.1 hypothetical protein [Paenibacillus sp. MMS18-CY102]